MAAWLFGLTASHGLLHSLCRFMEITQKELYLFLQKSGARTMAALKATTAKLTEVIQSDSAFSTFYSWNFEYYRNSQEEAKKFIPTATASQVHFPRQETASAAENVIVSFPETPIHRSGPKFWFRDTPKF